MNVTTDFVACSLDELKALLDGGTLTVYSVARPITADQPVERSGVLATFTFASPAFAAAADGAENPVFAANPVPASSVGTPGFAGPARPMAPSLPISPPAPATGRSSSAKCRSRKARR